MPLATRIALSMTVLIALTLLVGGCGPDGDGSGGASSPSTPATSSSTSPSTSTTSPVANSPSTLSAMGRVLSRALTTQVHISSYAFSIDTWLLEGETPVEILRARGMVRRPWSYFEIVAAAEPDTILHLALSDERRLARTEGSDWADAATAVPESLRDLPLENPTPEADLIEGAAAKAVVAFGEPPAFAPPPPPEAATQLTWVAQLETGVSVAAHVHSWAWIDERGRLIRLDRETIPVTGGETSVRHTYTTISYSRHADPTLEPPLPEELL